MKDVLKCGNIISKIRDGIDLDKIAEYTKTQVFSIGPVDTVILEILSYFKLFQPNYFKNFELEIIETMGLFYKNVEPDTLQGVVFDMYCQYIKDTYGDNYTPMQADILKQIKNKQFFSFSAPTSTGKSFVFRNLIKGCQNDVVIIVPSRALINEYYDRIVEIIDVKTVNVLTFVDRINTKHTIRNIFILTPERARELFKNKNWLKIDLFLLDEAQLSDENSVRGLYFDSIVRRSLKTFPDAKYVFAHPFIENPEAQLKRNDVIDASGSSNYNQKNVGQIFYVHDATNKKFYHFGTDKTVLGKRKLEAKFDPIENTICNGGVYSFMFLKRIFTTKLSISNLINISNCAHE